MTRHPDLRDYFAARNEAENRANFTSYVLGYLSGCVDADTWDEAIAAAVENDRKVAGVASCAAS